MAVASPRYDIARFGAEVLRFSPRQSDVLMVMGTITDKMVPVLKEIYEQMAEPKWVICMGACATSGGFYRSYHVQQGIDEAIPVDVYIPGCPPTPEAVLRVIIRLEDEIKLGAPQDTSSRGPPNRSGGSKELTGAARQAEPACDLSFAWRLRTRGIPCIAERAYCIIPFIQC